MQKGKIKLHFNNKKETSTSNKNKKSIRSKSKKKAVLKFTGKESVRFTSKVATKEVNKNAEDNIGTKAVKELTTTTENTMVAVDRYKTIRAVFKNNKLNQSKRTSSQLGTKLESNINNTSKSTSRSVQKKSIKKKYNVKSFNQIKSNSIREQLSNSVQVIAKGGKEIAKKILANPKVLIIIATLLLLFVIISSVLTSCSLVLQSTVSNVISTSYTSEDIELITVENNYSELEYALENRIDNLEEEYTDYDEYNYNVGLIGHDPHQLISYLTVKYLYFTASEVQTSIETLFTNQYQLSLEEVIEIRYKMEIIDDELVEVEYEYKILNITLSSTEISIIAESEFTESEYAQYQAYLECSGNKPYIFGGGSSDTSVSANLTGVVFINGERAGNQTIVDIAKSQVGNVGGQPYWSWYGFNSRVAWCATFVSWCLNQAGYTSPKFASCHNQGIPYFSSNGRWANSSYRDMTAGDIIFFDWNNDNRSDHVGIVVGYDMTKIYTVEGNSGDAVKIKSYDLTSNSIMGYGLMN